MEISYDSGAKVILQGPCTYEVDSAAGGFLSLGKLTARVERSEVRRIRGQKSEISTPLSPLPYPLFAVRTPTAIVTDLGTEFGVEVDKSGATQSHVFRGKIELRLARRRVTRRAIRLGEGQSARGANAEGRPVVMRRNSPQRNILPADAQADADQGCSTREWA